MVLDVPMREVRRKPKIPAAGEAAEADPEKIYRSAYPFLLTTASRLVPASDAPDLVHEALVETLSRHPDFHGIDHPLGYVRTVMLRLAGRKRRFKEIAVDVQILLETPSPDHVDDTVSVEALAALLPVRQRTCVVLRFAYGFDDATIGAVLGCRQSTVRSNIARALSALRERGPADA